MMTQEDIKRVWGDDVILLFKGREPFTEIKKDIPAGVLIENSSGKVPCYLCEEWFENLQTHIWQKHKVKPRDYKIEYGFNRNAPLCSRIYSEKQSKNATSQMTPERLEKMMVGRKKSGRPKGSYMLMQEKNRRNTCPEQIKARIELLIGKFGANLSLRQVREVDSGIGAYAFRHYGSWNKFKKAWGMTEDVSSQKKQKGELMYTLRAFVKEHKKMPWSKEHQRLNNFPYSQQPYITEFGSIAKAKLICGVKKNRYNEYYLWN